MRGNDRKAVDFNGCVVRSYACMNGRTLGPNGSCRCYARPTLMNELAELSLVAGTVARGFQSFMQGCYKQCVDTEAQTKVTVQVGDGGAGVGVGVVRCSKPPSIGVRGHTGSAATGDGGRNQTALNLSAAKHLELPFCTRLPSHTAAHPLPCSRTA